MRLLVPERGQLVRIERRQRETKVSVKFKLEFT